MARVDRFSVLPNELLLMIFKTFTSTREHDPDEHDSDDIYIDRADKKVLASICTVSRKFSLLAQPLLYESYEKVNNAMTREEFEAVLELPSTQIPPKPNDSLQSFLCTLIQRPDLAARVKTLVIEP